MTNEATASGDATQPGAVALTEGLGLVPERWYVVSREGLATLCKDEADAKRYAPECDRMYSRAAPHRALLLGDVAAERERWEKHLGAEMPADFKDWHENAASERPEVAASVISALRLRESDALDIGIAAKAHIERLERWKSTHAPRLNALRGLLDTAQREAAEGAEARATLASERAANAALTQEVERLRALLERAAADVVRADVERAQIVAAERHRWDTLLSCARRIAENNAERADDCGMLSRALLDALNVLRA